MVLQFYLVEGDVQGETLQMYQHMLWTAHWTAAEMRLEMMQHCH